MQEFALSLHPDKTRLIEFGRHAADRRAKVGLGKPETFRFLGFVFICGKTRRGKFLVHRKSRRDRMRAKLKEVKKELRRRMHQPIPEQGRWLAQVVRGYFAYHAVPTNGLRNQRFPLLCGGVLATHAPASKSERPLHVGTDQTTGRRLASSTSHPSPLAERALRRQILEVRTGCLNWARPGPRGGR